MQNIDVNVNTMRNIACECPEQVAPGEVATAPTDASGALPKFASVADYLKLLNMPGSRKGGQFYPQGIVLVSPPSPSVPIAATAGRRLLRSS